jgi:hypothetical protein
MAIPSMIPKIGAAVAKHVRRLKGSKVAKSLTARVKYSPMAKRMRKGVEGAKASLTKRYGPKRVGQATAGAALGAAAGTGYLAGKQRQKRHMMRGIRQ